VEEYDPVKTSVKNLVEALVDRGYGYVYTSSASNMREPNAIMATMLDKLQKIAVDGGGLAADDVTSRRLSTVEVAREAFWSCDDTLVECSPVCLKTTGRVTNRVSNKQCQHLPTDTCACAGKCFHKAEWRCYGIEIKCFAQTGRDDAKLVGDMVCDMRGTPKPEELPGCEPLPASVGSLPADECLRKAPEVTTEAPVSSTTAPIAAVEPEEQRPAEPKITIVTSSAFLLSCIFYFAW
jgi:hypothetical protein